MQVMLRIWLENLVNFDKMQVVSSQCLLNIDLMQGMSRIWLEHLVNFDWMQACHAYEWDMSRIWMSHVTHMNEACHV